MPQNNQNPNIESYEKYVKTAQENVVPVNCRRGGVMEVSGGGSVIPEWFGLESSTLPGLGLTVIEFCAVI